MPGVPRDTTRRIGLLGGSFNPAHDGHRHVSLEALRRVGLDEVWWLVSPQNPLKAGDGMEPLATRVARAKQIAHHPRIRVEAPELLLGTRYTLDTVRALNRLYPKARFVWLMGSDILPQLVDWAGWRELFASIPIAAFAPSSRAGSTATPPPPSAPCDRGERKRKERPSQIRDYPNGAASCPTGARTPTRCSRWCAVHWTTTRPRTSSSSTSRASPPSPTIW